GRVRDVAVARDLVAGVHDDDPLPQLLRKHAGHLPQFGRLAAPGPPEHQDALAALHHVLDDVNGSVDGAPDPTGQADDPALTVANGGDAVQRALDPGAVVLAERADALRHKVEVFRRDGVFAQFDDALREAGFR